MAIEKLSVGFGANPMEKILLAKRYCVSGWSLVKGYARLVGQQAPLDTKTLDSLVWKTNLSLLSLGDRYPAAIYGDAGHEGYPAIMTFWNRSKSKYGVPWRPQYAYGSKGNLCLWIGGHVFKIWASISSDILYFSVGRCALDILFQHYTNVPCSTTVIAKSWVYKHGTIQKQELEGNLQLHLEELLCLR